MATVGRIIVGVLVINAVLLLYSAHAARLKDIADIEGVRGNQLYGYGIVIGLNGTGDGNSVDFTTKSISNMIEKMGIRVDPADINVKNVAGVVVTAELPPFVRPGTKLDVTVSSLGDAKSLEGGLLLLTQLKGADGNTYAVAQGSMSVGGFNVGAGGDATIKNHPTIGAIPNGAIVERTIPFDLFQSGRVRIVLRQPDFTTMTRVVSAINTNFGRKIAQAVDAASVEIGLTGPSAKDPITMVARLENIEVEQDIGARVVVNERTGTIVIGSSVRISTVALAHGNISLRAFHLFRSRPFRLKRPPD